MKDIIRIFKNIFYLFLREVFNKLTFIALVIFIGRYLGSKELGQFSFVLYFCQLIFLASDLGLSTLLIRDIAKNKDLVNKYVKNFCFIRIAIGIIVLFATCTIAITIGIGKNGEIIHIFVLSALSFFIVMVGDVFISAFRAYEKMNYELMVNLPKNFIFLLFSIWVILRGKGLEVIFFIFLLSNILTLIISYWIYKFKIPRSYSTLDYSFCKTAIKDALPFWLTMLFVTLYFRIDSLMLFFMKGSNEVGLYNAAYIAIDGYLMASGIIVTALFPFFSRIYKNSKHYLQNAYSKSLKAIFFLFFPASVLIFIFAGPIIHLAYGEKFTSSIPIVQILIWAGLFVAMGNLNGHLSYAINKQKIVMLTAFLGVLVNVTLNLLLIPSLSFLGASIATIITEAFLFLFLFLFIYFNFYKVSINKVFLKTILSAIIMVLFVVTFKDINISILIISSFIIYLIANYFIRGFVWEERGNIMQILFLLRQKVDK